MFDLRTSPEGGGVEVSNLPQTLENVTIPVQTTNSSTGFRLQDLRGP